jgi:hypothetical protein
VAETNRPALIDPAVIRAAMRDGIAHGAEHTLVYTCFIRGKNAD